jgi:hypothetical protein
MPPENSCGYCRKRRFGSGIPTLASSSTARRCASAAADGEDGIERGQRILKHDRHLTAADLEQSRRGQVEKIAAIEGRAHGSRLGAPRQ